jgi:hypothetical protein
MLGARMSMALLCLLVVVLRAAAKVRRLQVFLSVQIRRRLPLII